MSVARSARNSRGFSLLELMVAMAIFLIICAAMFELLQMSQKKYSGENQLSSTFQESRWALDQIVRDFDVSGYPPVDLFSVLPPGSPQYYASSPVAWSPNYPATPCNVGTAGGGTCTTPGDYDLIVETRIGTDATVSWIWYSLDPVTQILYREVVPKPSGPADPLSTVNSAGTRTPLVKNVMNNPGGALAQITADYPTMFPGGLPQPIFQYTCDTPSGPTPCTQAGASNSPQGIRDVDITLIVMTQQPDMQTQSLKLVELFGRGHRVNPAF